MHSAPVSCGVMRLKNLWQVQYQFEEAETNLVKATSIYPSWENHLWLADFYKFLNRFAEAEETYFRCVELSSSDYQRAGTLNNLGSLQHKKNEFVMAMFTFALRAIFGT